MYSHSAELNHRVENWSSKGVKVKACSSFKNIFSLSVQFHQFSENWAVQSNCVLLTSRARKGDFFVSVVTAGTDEERLPYFLTRLYSSARNSGNVCKVNCLIDY